MSELILYHNPRWGKSRIAVSLLNEKKINFTIIEYLKTPLSKTEILSLSEKLGRPISQFVRKNEKDFKKNQCEKYLNNNEKMAEMMNRFPKIMERPILVKGKKAVLGRPPEDVLELV